MDSRIGSVCHVKFWTPAAHGRVAERGTAGGNWDNLTGVDPMPSSTTVRYWGVNKCERSNFANVGFKLRAASQHTAGVFTRARD